MRHGSLCTGYDGIGMGLRLAGLPIEDAWCAEVEPAVAALLTTPNLGDVKAVDWTRVAPVEVLSSGDPCQSISVAGRQLGKEDPRFLWPWVRDAIEALRPRVVFLENVQGMVSHDQGRTMAERFTDLQALGYRVRWTVIGACAIGAPHHRHRWYAYAERSTASTPAVERVGTKAHCGAPRSGGRHLLPSPSAADGSGGPGRSDKRKGGDNLRTAVTLLPTPCARDREGRNEGSPEFWARKIERMPERAHMGAAVNLLPTPRATDGTNGGPNQRNSRGGYDALPGAAVNLLPTPTVTNRYGNGYNNRGELLLPGVASNPEAWGKFADAVALWEEITGVVAPAPTVPGPNGGVRLNPELPEWMMGLPIGHLSARMSRNDALKAAGNGVVPLQAAAAWRMLAD